MLYNIKVAITKVISVILSEFFKFRSSTKNKFIHHMYELINNDLTSFLCVCLVMKSLNSPQDFWQVDRVTTERKIHKLQEELERVTLENSRLLERSGVSKGGEKRFGKTGEDNTEKRTEKRDS